MEHEVKGKIGKTFYGRTTLWEIAKAVLRECIALKAFISTKKQQ